MNDKSERLLTKIGQLLSEDRAYPLDGTLLYAEVGPNYVSPSIFKNLGNHILYREPDLDRLGGALLDLWETQAEGTKWSEIEYEVRGSIFTVTYIYPDEIGSDEEHSDRRERVARRCFGEKPIVYPPWPPDHIFPSYDT